MENPHGNQRLSHINYRRRQWTGQGNKGQIAYASSKAALEGELLSVTYRGYALMIRIQEN